MFKGILGIIFGIATFISAGVFSLGRIQDFVRPSVSAPAPQENTSQVIVQHDVPEVKIPLPLNKNGAKSIQKVVTNKEKPPIKLVATPATVNGNLTPKETIAESTVVAPGPLIAVPPATSAPSWSLSVRGVIEYTNGARSLNGSLPALIENEVLDRDAKMKLDDMFAKQYFEHVSPLGVGPADLAARVGYAYIIVGENLALGDFGSDEKLVTAWMNSPGHRANILNRHYQEIGVAVGKGMYEGRETWLAVQSFGMPLSACPQIDAPIKIQIESNSTQITNQRAQIDAKKAQIDSTASSDPNYNVYISEFNNLLPPYNTLIESTRSLITEYNTEVQSYNNCVTSASVH